MARKRWTGTTTQRGLGTSHQQARVRALRTLQDGDPCARCQDRGIYHPMTRDLITWTGGTPTSRHLDLDDFPGRAIGGPQVKRLSYASCNRKAGGRLGGLKKAAARTRKPMTTSRAW
jgi:hypothetical protein